MDSKMVSMSAVKLVAEFARRGIFIDVEMASLLKSAVNSGGRRLHGAVLAGPPGTGKTVIFETLADILGYEVMMVACNVRTDDDALIAYTAFDDTRTSGFRLEPGMLVQAIQAVAEGRKVMLLLDEFDKTKEFVDTFALHFLQQGIVKKGDFDFELTDEEKTRLFVGVTMNDHRDPSPAFRRRLPYIFIKPLPVAVVAKALEDTNAGHPMLPTALNLYEKSLGVALEKPLTIQELREFLDAQDDEDDIKALGAHWFDEVVYTFLTKHDDDHRLLGAAVPNGATAPAKASRWDRPRFNAPSWFVAPPPKVKPQPVPIPAHTWDPAAQRVTPAAQPAAPAAQPAAPAVRPNLNRTRRFPTGNGFGQKLLNNA